MSESRATPAMSGKEIALARRRAISQNGGSAVPKKNGSVAARVKPTPAAIASTTPTAIASTTPTATVNVIPAATVSSASVGSAVSGRDISRARRASLATGGKNGAGSARASKVSAPVAAVAPAPTYASSENTETSRFESVASASNTSEAEAALESICSIVEQKPSEALSGTETSVRDLCRMRRQALSTQGKSAMPRKPGSGVAAAARRYGNGALGAVQGRETARQRRAALCQNGRGNAPVSRPSGRVRPGNGDAPPKVEVSTTLSGQHVTGTRVERASKVTGNEPGTCRAITGTEYISAEQFESFCETLPAPAAAKVGMSATSRGQWVSGTEIGRSVKVTGDEPGTCRPVTGTEYLGSEQFGEFCQGKGLLDRPEKVSIGITERRGTVISGSDEARANRTTGTEAGASRTITGSQYADAGVARLTINGPSKVALTHTLAGRPVSGTEVGRSVKVTGDEAGSCRAVSGTEYLSNEQFQSICQTKPESAPAKVGENSSMGGQRITGNLVDRTQKVTGNEPGSCQRVTGSQYSQGQPSLCGGGVEKVGMMHTLAGRALTGSRVEHGPKLSGDEHGGCQPVTGTEYYGQEQYASYCPGTPAPAAAKVGFSQSSHGLPVSGTMLGRTGKVTGNEPGSSMQISGTPYAGQEQMGKVCGCGCGCDGTPKTGAARPVMAARHPRYLAAADQPMPYPQRMAQFEQTRPEDFSIVSPARSAQGERERITGNAYGSAARITGPVNMGSGLVSGTPEFRYRDDGMLFQPAVQQAVEVAAAPRITGEGRADGMRITGDDWARSGRVTGTEGHWAQGRNPTLRGETRQTQWAQNAWANKERERPEAPPSAKVTGSSGNGGKGAMVTVSGGARG